MKILVSLIVSSCLLGQACAAQEDANSRYSSVLKDTYPDYEVVGPVGSPTDLRGWHLRFSPQSFRNDILVGDFNFDGIEDFAAALRKTLPGDEPGTKADGLGITVVCNGRSPTGLGASFECALLSDTAKVYLDLERLGSMYTEALQHSDPMCKSLLDLHKEQKVLVVPEHYGRCDTFYFSTSESAVEYLSCSICAD